jgi:hypothetical protein
MKEGVKMPVLQECVIDENLYSSLETKALNDNRTITEEVVSILKNFFSVRGVPRDQDDYWENATRKFLEIRWEDDRSAEEIIAEMKGSRVNKEKLENWTIP